MFWNQFEARLRGRRSNNIFKGISKEIKRIKNSRLIKKLLKQLI